MTSGKNIRMKTCRVDRVYNTFLKNSTQNDDIDGVGLEHSKLGYCNVKKVGRPQYPGAMHVVKNFQHL